MPKSMSELNAEVKAFFKNGCRLPASFAMTQPAADPVVDPKAGDVDPATDPLAPKAVRIIARTGGVAVQGYWGRCVNDMSGYIPATGPVPLDYAHQDGDTSDLVGVADTLSVVDGQLVATGRLVPYAAGDSASEIIFKGAAGVPYQASIVLDMNTLQILEVPQGQTVQVNGADFVGPGVVFTKWGVSGIAILPYGADSSTSVQFGNAREEAAKFVAIFGATRGGEWFIAGKTYDEALSLHVAAIKSDFAAKSQQQASDLKLAQAKLISIRAEIEKEKKRASFHRGQARPVPVRPTSTEPDCKPSDAGVRFGRSPGQQALVDLIASKMPGKRTVV